MNIPKKYLAEKILIESKLITADDIFKLLLQDKNAKVGMAATSDPNFSYYKKLASAAASGRVQGKHGAKSRLDLNSIKLSRRTEAMNLGLKSSYNSLSNVLNELQELMKSKGHYDPNNETSNIIQKTTLEILASVSGIKSKNTPVDDQQEDPKDQDNQNNDEQEDQEDTENQDGAYPEGKIDWTAYKAKKLADDGKAGKSASQSLEEFYEIYYRKEYAGLKSEKEPDTEGIVDKLKSLNKVLIPEFNKLGYNPEVNPLAQFLKILIKLKDTGSKIFDKLTINTYGAIHNAFIDKFITGNMLGNHRDDKKGDNLLFCEDLYNYKGLTIVNYLDLQDQVLDKAESTYPNVNDIIARIFIKQKQFDKDYTANVKALMEADNSIIIKVENSAAKLKSELEIRELYNHLFNTEAKKVLSDKTMQAIAIKAKANGATADMVKYLLDTVNSRAMNTSKITNYAEVTKWLKQQDYKKKEVLYNWSKNLLTGYSLEDHKKAMKFAITLIVVYNAKEQTDKEKDDK